MEEEPLVRSDRAPRLISDLLVGSERKGRQ